MPYFLGLKCSPPHLSYGELWLKKEFACMSRSTLLVLIRVNFKRNHHFVWLLLTSVPNQQFDAVGDLEILAGVRWLQISAKRVSRRFRHKLNFFVLHCWHLQIAVNN